MSSPATTSGPEWELVDRLRRALRYGGVTPKEMALHLGVHRNTISNYLSGHHAPSKPVLLAWAARCGVEVGWLEHGAVDEHGAPIILGMYMHKLAHAS